MKFDQISKFILKQLFFNLMCLMRIAMSHIQILKNMILCIYIILYVPSPPVKNKGNDIV